MYLGTFGSLQKKGGDCGGRGWLQFTGFFLEEVSSRTNLRGSVFDGTGKKGSRKVGTLRQRVFVIVRRGGGRGGVGCCLDVAFMGADHTPTGRFGPEFRVPHKEQGGGGGLVR